MSQGKEVVVVGNENPFTVLMSKCNEFNTFYNKWTAKQCLPIEVSINTITGAVQGASFSFGLTALLQCFLPPHAPLGEFNAASFAQARNYAAFAGVNAGITSVMKRLRGTEDFTTCLMAGFGSGVAGSIVGGMRDRDIIHAGVFFALLYCGTFAVKKKFNLQRVEGARYDETRHMLAHLGFKEYEKNFKKGLLYDKTLPLLTERALQEVKIPPGPRLLILEHIGLQYGTGINGNIDTSIQSDPWHKFF